MIADRNDAEVQDTVGRENDVDLAIWVDAPAEGEAERDEMMRNRHDHAAFYEHDQEGPGQHCGFAYASCTSHLHRPETPALSAPRFSVFSRLHRHVSATRLLSCAHRRTWNIIMCRGALLHCCFATRCDLFLSRDYSAGPNARRCDNRTS